MLLIYKTKEARLLLVIEILFGIVFLIVLYWIVRKIVNSPSVQKHAAERDKKFKDDFEHGAYKEDW